METVFMGDSKHTLEPILAAKLHDTTTQARDHTQFVMSL